MSRPTFQQLHTPAGYPCPPHCPGCQGRSTGSLYCRGYNGRGQGCRTERTEGGPANGWGAQPAGTALRSPGAPSGGGRGGGEAGENKDEQSEGQTQDEAKRRTRKAKRARTKAEHPKAAQQHQEKDNKADGTKLGRSKTPRGAEPQARLCRAMPRGGRLP